MTDYFAFRAGETLAALLLALLASRLIRAGFWHRERTMAGAILPNLWASAGMTLTLGWSAARGGHPNWVALAAEYGIAGLILVVIDAWRFSRSPGAAADQNAGDHQT